MILTLEKLRMTAEKYADEFGDPEEVAGNAWNRLAGADVSECMLQSPVLWDAEIIEVVKEGFDIEKFLKGLGGERDFFLSGMEEIDIGGIHELVKSGIPIEEILEMDITHPDVIATIETMRENGVSVDALFRSLKEHPCARSEFLDYCWFPEREDEVFLDVVAGKKPVEVLG